MPKTPPGIFVLYPMLHFYGIFLRNNHSPQALAILQHKKYSPGGYIKTAKTGNFSGSQKIFRWGVCYDEKTSVFDENLRENEENSVKTDDFVQIEKFLSKKRPFLVF